eukprot:9112380-Pyramimonas_sp.AAC.1
MRAGSTTLSTTWATRNNSWRNYSTKPQYWETDIASFEDSATASGGPTRTTTPTPNRQLRPGGAPGNRGPTPPRPASGDGAEGELEMRHQRRQ